MKKDKLMLAILIIAILIIIGLCTIPKFLNFMELQNDILKMKGTQVFEVSENYTNLRLPKTTIVNSNVPAPKEIKEKNFKVYQDRMKQEQLMAEQKRIVEQQRIESEKKKIEIAKQQEETKQAPTVTARAEETPRVTPSNYLTFTATGYCPCVKCCGKSNGRTAMGTIAKQGRTVAMSGNYKFGTQVEIEGMGIYTVEDRGGAIQGNRIDIFFSTHEQALNFGKKKVKLRVL